MSARLQPNRSPRRNPQVCFQVVKLLQSVAILAASVPVLADNAIWKPIAHQCGGSGYSAKVDVNHVSTGRARFDPALNAWILTQYADVLAALREPRLCQIASQKKSESDIGNKATPSQKRDEVRAALSQSSLLEWHGQIELLAVSMLDRLPTDRPVDLVREFIRPWCLAISALITGVDRMHCRSLADLARDLPGGDAECYNSVLKSRIDSSVSELSKNFRRGAMRGCTSAFRAMAQTLRYSIATFSLSLRQRFAKAKLKKFVEQGIVPDESLFVGTSQTLPAFLSTAWCALFRDPGECARLRAAPDLMPRAIDELLRYAGIVHTLFREATADLELDSILIRRNERLILKLGSANRDPARFSEPNRLDLNRPLKGQLGLGAGPHACPGMSLVRMATDTATRAFINRFVGAAH
jgi:cytochrome P450